MRALIFYGSISGQIAELRRSCIEGGRGFLTASFSGVLKTITIS
jgi:hypothetical protein